MAIYHLGLIGGGSAGIKDRIKQAIVDHTAAFGLRIGTEINIHEDLDSFQPLPSNAAAIAFLGSPASLALDVTPLLHRGIPIVPVASTIRDVSTEIPVNLRFLNVMGLDQGGEQRIASALLECVGLLPRQRRVFVSYRRSEATPAAIQLFDSLSAKNYDVFLDTHGISPAQDFQGLLWHRLCDSDVLIMLDSASYFESRWTSAEFGRALAKNIAVLRVGLPNVHPSRHIQTSFQIQLTADDIHPTTGLLNLAIIDQITTMLESARSKSHAVRSMQIFSQIKQAIEAIGGSIQGVGPRGSIHLILPDESHISLMTTTGVPTSNTMHQAFDLTSGARTAVVFDHVGIHQEFIAHLRWLAGHVRPVKWIHAAEAAWELAGLGPEA